MYLTRCHIEIGKLTFDFVKSVEVDSSWDMLTDTAKIVLPANIKVDKNKLSEQLSVGLPVLIQLGYGSVLETIFTGYVSDVKPSVPIEVMCEDEMWKLKQSDIVDSGRKTKLLPLLQKHIVGIDIKAIDAEIGAYHIDHISMAKYLETIKSDFGLFSFMRNKTLVVGLQYDPETTIKHRFNIDGKFKNISSDDLVFKRKDQVKIKVKAISNNSNGTKTEVELGDADGESRTLNFYNLSQSELQKAAEREINRLRYDGWRGSITAFGEPFVKHGDIVIIKQTEDGEKEGSYWIDSVKYQFGTSGYQQTIKLGARNV
jgi:hypothetical protein